LLPALAHTEEKITANDAAFNKKVDRCVETYAKALMDTHSDLQNATDYDAEYKLTVKGLKNLYASKKPLTASDFILNYAINNPNTPILFPLKDAPEMSFSIPGSELMRTIFYRESLASLYAALYEKTKHRKFYDTDTTIEKNFFAPAAFR